MGLKNSKNVFHMEKPSEKFTATLYYFNGRGLADQIRWMLAATNVSFVQREVQYILSII